MPVTGAVTPATGRARRRRDRAYAVAISPAALVLALFFAGPALWAVYISLTDLSLLGFGASARFIGLDNYRRFWHDPDVPKIIRNTVVFVVWAAIVGETACGLLLAVLLNYAKAQRYRLGDLAFAAVLLAWISPPLLTAFIWARLLDERNGVFNGALAALGFHRISYLGDHAITCVIVVEIWKGIGFATVVFLGALQSVPQSVYEAARVDGAGAIARFRDHTLPLLRNVAALVLTMTTIVAAGSFLMILLLTNGDPGLQTETLALFAFHQGLGLQSLDIGYGSAISVVLLIGNTLFAAIYLRAARERS